MSTVRGRPKSKIMTKYFLFSESSESDDQKKDEKKCVFCQWTSKAGTSRLLDHLVKCKNCPENVVKEVNTERGIQPTQTACSTFFDLDGNGIASSVTSSAAPSTSSHPPESTDLPRPSKAPRLSTRSGAAGTIDNYVTRLSAKDNEELQKLLARAIFVTGTPFSSVENPYWRQFFTALNPAFQPPSAYKLSNQLLDEESATVDGLTRSRLDRVTEPSLILTTDGWTSIVGESIVNFCVCEPRSLFVGSEMTGGTSHTADFMADLISNKLEEIGPTKILAVVTDNAANMRAAWNIIQEKYPHITCFGCGAHGLNLLLRDFMTSPSLESFLKSATKVVKSVNNRPVLKSRRQELSCGTHHTLKQHVETRWYSWMECLSSLTDNQVALEKLVLDREHGLPDKTSDIRSIVLNDIFWDRVRSVRQVVKTVTDAIAVVEEDKTPTLSCVALLLQEMRAAFFGDFGMVSLSPLSRLDEAAFAKKFEDRRAFILGDSGIHAAAAILDPHVNGRGLSPEEILDGCNFLSSLSCGSESSQEGTITSELAAYRSREGVFEKQFLWNGIAQNNDSLEILLSRRAAMPPKTWWSAFFTGTRLANVALRVLNIVASSAAVERANSVQLRIHSKERNRLLHHRVEKLMKISVNRRIQSGQKRQRHVELVLPPLDEVDEDTS